MDPALRHSAGAHGQDTVGSELGVTDMEKYCDSRDNAWGHFPGTRRVSGKIEHGQETRREE